MNKNTISNVNFLLVSEQKEVWTDRNRQNLMIVVTPLPTLSSGGLTIYVRVFLMLE